MSEQQHSGFETDSAQPAAEVPQIGATLRAAREARGEPPEQVAAALKFSLKQVLAMEAERVHELPGPAFVKGFYRNYGRYLGVDVEPMIAARWPEPSARSVELAPVTNARGTMPGSGRGAGVGRAFAALVAVLVLVLALGWYFDGFQLGEQPAQQADAEQADMPGDEAAAVPEVEILDDDPPVAAMIAPADTAPSQLSGPGIPARIETPAPTPSGSSAEPASSQDASPDTPPAAPQASSPAQVGTAPATPEPTPAPTPEPTPEPAPEPTPAPNAAASRDAPTSGAATPATGSGASRLVFRLAGDAWLQVKDAQDRTLYAGTSRAGTTRVVQGDPPFWVTVGNATAVELEFDGNAVDLAPHMHTAGVARLVLE